MEILTKQALRDRLLRERQAMDSQSRAIRSLSVLGNLGALAQYRAAKHVAGYIPILAEVDVLSWLSGAAVEGKRVYLPRLMDGGTLDFAAYDPRQLTKGPRGVLQPAPELPSVPITELDFLVIPGLGFDRRRFRLGLGAGYYDKTLAGLSTRPFSVGVGFDFQIIEQFPVESWDLPVDCVVSESGTY
jgi:5-formyltetrahydrofolate cyclo-ligase